MREIFDADVIVVGAGPVGTVALGLMGRAGLRAIGIDKDQQIWPTARAVHFDGETFRTLQSLGVTDEFRKVTIPMASMHMENEAREILLRLPTGQFGSQGWHDDLNFHQPDIEALLRDVVDGLPNVDLRVGVEALAVRNTDIGVEVDIRDADGSETTLRARWAIAADGARSAVRQSFGIEADRFGEDRQWVVVDGHLVDSPGYEDDMIFLGHHTRPALWVRLPGSRVRMEFMVMPGDDPEEIVTPEGIERISHGVLPADRFTPDRQVLYTFRGRIARQWRIGNVFLAGDAAHLAPPMFGQGLCAGIRDVANLSWKLDLVARGLADDGLLDTYETERKPHARAWVEQAVQAALYVQTTDPAVAAERDAVIRANPASLAPVSPRLGPGIHTGDVDERAGALSVQPILEDGTRLDDLVGRRFVVAAAREAYDALDPDLRSRLEDDRDVAVLLDESQTRGLLEASGGLGVVVRPDRYVLGVADSAAELAALIQRLPSQSRPAVAV
ncbi:bifunctional 3-(3-hydroxy-phenyl)propionate/3-hydroxycinnamic acid hydroxylase [Leucobacter tenebrionis]|uniref:bifunctional 3-(3-hydroxy-phenyl)propionate/3-hydroxycinnamic acid hydroxylase n=1 Tax=Leucobacter tenebrionis TaxID=2873270 RepID=UPI001CA62BB5|nr:bifunctional 3-(3-hydroxy-phenyl)propionate/3-hydroxycinnamic acid hydroxylase [Leucobacter tenebrionis]QZY50632.1 bifunctional 3-(3-hydroxy-phenyl)propionate/3-hydroxycinnamic acid hydroxylase [Leucobacter tenebrionis]